MKQSILLTIVVSCMSGFLNNITLAQEATKPNIVLILLDDMGYGDVGAFGGKKCKTPVIDQMANEGLKLTSFYAAPVCSASRAQIQTGCYAPRVSIPGVLLPGSSQGLNPAENTIAKLLKEQGYATMCVGKWHLGDQPEFLPLRHGFDHYFGIAYSNDMLLPKAGTTEKVVPLIRDDKVVAFWTLEDQDQTNKVYTEEAVKFIRENKDRPFYLYLSHNAVHVPLRPGAEFRGKSGNGLYYDWVEEIDWSTGQVLDVLRELKLDNNTLVIFTSDNGPWLCKGVDSGTAGPLRGGKGSTWEGGMRVATIARWPGRVPAQTVTDTVAGEIDLLPTFVSLAGGKIPKEKPIDGVDISKLLLGESKVSPREVHFFYDNYNLEAVRSGPWKLALKPQRFSMGFKENSIHYGESKGGLRLYNLEKDIGETTDVAAENPEIVAKLKALAAERAAELCDGEFRGPGIRKPGKVDSPQTLYPMDKIVQKKKPEHK